MVGRSVGWLVGRLVGRSVGQLVGWLVGWYVGTLVGRSVLRSVGWSASRSVGRLEDEVLQINSLIYTMRKEAEHIFKAFTFTCENEKKYAKVVEKLDEHFVPKSNS